MLSKRLRPRFSHTYLKLVRNHKRWAWNGLEMASSSFLFFFLLFSPCFFLLALKTHYFFLSMGLGRTKWGMGGVGLAFCLMLFLAQIDKSHTWGHTLHYWSHTLPILWPTKFYFLFPFFFLRWPANTSCGAHLLAFNYFANCWLGLN